jgi:hypothetical protein
MSIAPALAIALELIFVHAPGGQEIELNSTEISSIRQPHETEEHFADDVHCVIIMSNGRLIGTAETCAEVIKQIVNPRR